MADMELIEGMKAPNFSLSGSDKKEHKLEDYLGKKVVLFFYPKDSTPGWTNEATAFRDNMKAFNDLDTVILGISRDSIASHEKFINKNELPFILLSDSEETVCTLYGVLKGKTMFGKKVMGIERSTFIINAQGNIEKIYRKVKVDGHVESILEFLRS